MNVWRFKADIAYASMWTTPPLCARTPTHTHGLKLLMHVHKGINLLAFINMRVLCRLRGIRLMEVVSDGFK